MVRKKNRIGVRSIGQKAIADFLDAELPEKAETIFTVDELPLTFKPGTIFTFGNINSARALRILPRKVCPAQV